MRSICLCALVLLALACQNADRARLGRPGDPGYVGSEALGSSRVHAGAIDGEFAAATFHLAYYEQPHAAPLIGLEYGAYDTTRGGRWLHVALWAQAELPAVIDLASYRAETPDGELAGAQVELAAASAPDVTRQDLQRAQAGRLSIDAAPDQIALTLSGLVWGGARADSAAPASGRAEGDVVYECWRYDPQPAPPAPREVGRHLVALPNANDAALRYVEDRDMSSDFCRGVLP